MTPNIQPPTAEQSREIACRDAYNCESNSGRPIAPSPAY